LGFRAGDDGTTLLFAALIVNFRATGFGTCIPKRKCSVPVVAGAAVAVFRFLAKQFRLIVHR